MTHWQTLHRDKIPLVIFTVGFIGLATIVVISILNCYRLLMSDFLKVVGNGTTIFSSMRKRKTSESMNGPTKEEWRGNGISGKIITSTATANLVEKIRDATYDKGKKGFHPISKDVNKFMNSSFGDEVMEVFEITEEKIDESEANVSRQRKPTSRNDDGDFASLSDELSSSLKKDD